jgi:hypothetical protein
MFPFWLILGSLVVLSGIFNKRLLQLLGLRPMSEVFTTPNIKRSSRRVEQIGQWLMITLGVSFLVHGLGTALPEGVSSLTSSVLLGLSVVLLLAMFGISIMNWRAK